LYGFDQILFGNQIGIVFNFYTSGAEVYGRLCYAFQIV
jgi:hypothetical protein